MILLYPNDPFSPKRPDEVYAAEYDAAVAGGISACLFSYEDFCTGPFSPRHNINSNETVIYRGWMLTPSEYTRLCQGIQKKGASMLTSPEEYILCHYLPSWYPALTDYTPTTYFYSESDDIAGSLRELGWTGCFLKDYVKSLSTDGGSMISDLDNIPEVISKMKKYRGQIEGGLCARQIEDLDSDSESRHFVFRGFVHSPAGNTPEVVSIAASKIKSPFFSVDTIRRRDGTIRIVELGDGQVSDRKEWSGDQFIQIFKDNESEQDAAANP